MLTLLLYSEHLKKQNTSMIDLNAKNMDRLMKNVRTAINRRFEHDKKNGHNEPVTRVIVVTSGATYQENGAGIENCILKLNRAATQAAHKHGFAVLERRDRAPFYV